MRHPLFSFYSHLSLIGTDKPKKERSSKTSKLPEAAAASGVVANNPGDFSNFPQIDQTTRAGLIARGITALFPVQYETFNKIYNKEDVLVRDLTGSGKTLGFCLPMVQRLRTERLFGSGKPQAMILAPTRELAL